MGEKVTGPLKERVKTPKKKKKRKKKEKNRGKVSGGGGHGNVNCTWRTSSQNGSGAMGVKNWARSSHLIGRRPYKYEINSI